MSQSDKITGTRGKEHALNFSRCKSVNDFGIFESMHRKAEKEQFSHIKPYEEDFREIRTKRNETMTTDTSNKSSQSYQSNLSQEQIGREPYFPSLSSKNNTAPTSKNKIWDDKTLSKLLKRF